MSQIRKRAKIPAFIALNPQVEVMRPRFSLRLALALLALASVALCVFVARPTMLANQFVAAIESKDLAAARAMTVDGSAWDQMMDPPKSTKALLLTTQLRPREWRDLLSGQRRILLIAERQIMHHGAKVGWAEGVDVVAHPTGIEIKPVPFPNGIAKELPPGPPPMPKKAPSLSPN